MPQFDPTTFSSQIFWLIITFSTLYLIVWKFIIPKVNNILEKRESVIAHDLDKVKELRSDAEKILTDYEVSISSAFEKKENEIKKIIDSCKEEAEIKNKELNKELDEKILSAEKRILLAKTEAIKDINTVAVEIADVTSTSLTGINFDKNTIENLVENITKGDK